MNNSSGIAHQPRCGMPAPPYLSQTGISREWSLVKLYAPDFFRSPVQFIKQYLNPSFETVPLHPLTKVTLCTTIFGGIGLITYLVSSFLSQKEENDQSTATTATTAAKSAMQIYSQGGGGGGPPTAAELAREKEKAR